MHMKGTHGCTRGLCRPSLVVPEPRGCHWPKATRSDSGDSSVSSLISLRRSGLVALSAAMLTSALLTTAVEPPEAVAAGGPAGGPASNRTGALDFKPRDLEFPTIFEGTWSVGSVLTKIDLPFGPEAVPDMRQVRRAEAQDLLVRRTTTMRFVKGGQGSDAPIIMDRKYNTAALISEYMPDMGIEKAMERIQSSPDHMVINLPGGLSITSDVMRRMQQRTSDDALMTSELYQQFIEDPLRPKLKASRADTKWRWREEDGRREIIATQVIADFADPADGTSKAPVQSIGQPVVVMQYRMTLVPLETTTLVDEK